MTAGRYGVLLVAVGVSGLLATAALAVLMLSGLKWMDDNGVYGDAEWVWVLFIGRLIIVPIMLCVCIRLGCRAMKIMMRRVEVFPPTANSAITYYGVIVAYLILTPFIPIFAVFTPALIEMILYPLTAILLLLVTVDVISKAGIVPGPPVVSPGKAVLLATASWMVVIGASVAYGRFVLVGDAVNCAAWECPPERTVSVLGFVIVSATLTAMVTTWGLRSPMGMSRAGTVSALAFASVALLFQVSIIPAFVMPYDAFVPGFFYGVSAVVFLIVAVGRRDDEEPVGSSSGLTAG